MKEERTINNSKSRKKKKSGFRIYIFMAFALFFATAFYLATNKYFMIEDILVSGNNKYANEEIIACSQIKKGDNLFKIKPKRIKQNLIDKYEYIQDVNVKITFPTAVILQIKQAEPYALFKDKDDFLLISENGRVLERTNVLVNTKMPIVMGMGKIKSTTKKLKTASEEISDENSEQSNEENNQSGSLETSQENTEQNDDETENTSPFMDTNETPDDTFGFQPGDYISKENSETLAMLSSLLAAFEKTDFVGVTKIDITDRLNMKIVYQDRLLILLGSEDNLEYKLNFVKHIEEYNEDTNFQGVIDATIPKQLRVREMDIDSLINEDENYYDNYQIPEMINNEPPKTEEKKEEKTESIENEKQEIN